MERYHGQVNFDRLMIGKSLSRNLYRKFSDKFDRRGVQITQSFEIEKLDKTQIEFMLRDLARALEIALQIDAAQLSPETKRKIKTKLDEFPVGKRFSIVRTALAMAKEIWRHDAQ